MLIEPSLQPGTGLSCRPLLDSMRSLTPGRLPQVPGAQSGPRGDFSFIAFGNNVQHFPSIALSWARSGVFIY